MTESLESLLDHCWCFLSSAANDFRAPTHTPALATGDINIGVRIVVLRETDRSQRKLRCHTDRRSAKVRQLQTNATSAWLFYDPSTYEQIRVVGPTRIHSSGPVFDRLWRAANEAARNLYRQTNSPGTCTDMPVRQDSGVAIDARDNFAVLESEVAHVDYLKLAKTGHQRAQFEWQNNQYIGRWVAP